MKMWTTQKNFGPLDLKRVFVFILGVATLSFLLSYQLGQRVLYIETEEASTNARSSHDIKMSFHAVAREKNVGRSLNMHSGSNEKLEAKPTSLFSRLLQVEEKLLEQRRRRIIGLVGLSENSGAELLSRVRNIGAALGQTVERVREGETGEREVVIQGNYSMVLCVGESRDCPEVIRSKSGNHQRTNRILAVEKELGASTKLCKLANTMQQREPPCHDLHEKTAHTLASDRRIYPVIIANDQSGSIVSVYYNKSTVSVVESEDQTSVSSMWTFSTTPLYYQSGPALRLEVLVTSHTPLRLYISPTCSTGPLEALSQPGLFSEQVSLEDILQHVGEKYGLSTSSHWWRTIQILLMKYFVSVEMASQNYAASDRCLHCFGTYTVVIVCTNIHHCFIMQMKPLLPGSRSDLLGPMLQLLTSEKMATMDVFGALEEALKNSDFLPCQEQRTLNECLSDDVFAYILEDRRESLESTDLVKIYPTASSSIFTPFLSNLKTSLYTNALQSEATYQLHPLLMEVEKHYARLVADVPDHFDVSDETELYGADIDILYQDTLAPVQATRKTARSCTTDKSYYREHSDIKTEPPITLQQYSHDEYHTTVDYDIIMIKLMVTARHCNCEVRFGDLLEPAGPTNFTLGLGENVVRILLIDTSYQGPKIIRTVKLYLFREARGPREMVTNVGVLRTCSLIQDCSLPFDKSVPCGLQGRNVSWGWFNEIKKPACDSGDVPGAWVVPCTDCRSEKSCHWNVAKWQPDTCSYRYFTNDKIQKCLEKKNILFIGDSTNRGIMHHLIERTNGTLNSMDKTHTLKTYPYLNKGNTNMAFAYYPHFWLPAKHRPKFHKVLYQLIKRSLPLGNNATTVLVVGGVHWLAKRHIDVILAALKRTGFSNITKVVKGLGAGFHQNINGVRFVTKENQAKLLMREREVLQYAKVNGFKVVGTFNMTMARYKDFTEGKCACHFHRISKRRDTQEQLYTVEGDINAEYSQILLHNICDIS